MRFFIDINGKCYKAKLPKDPSDMERLNPSQEQLDALPDDGSGIYQTDMINNMQKAESVTIGKLTAAAIISAEAENEVV